MPKISDRKIIASSAPGSIDPIPATGTIEFPDPELPIEACDQILGLYLREWNQLEHALFAIFNKLLGAHETAARIIDSSSMGAATKREILTALAGQRLFKEDCEVFEALLKREQKATTKRNKLVHGSWMISVKKNDDGSAVSEWKRWYEPSDPRVYAEMHGKDADQKIRDEHEFSISRIVEIISETNQLTNEIKAFSESVSIAPFPNPRPVKSFSQPNEK